VLIPEAAKWFNIIGLKYLFPSLHEAEIEFYRFLSELTQHANTGIRARCRALYDLQVSSQAFFGIW
jgi:hypothetical protein